MISTICLMFLSGFLIWMNTSNRIPAAEKPAVLAPLAAYPVRSKWIATALFAAASALCVQVLGVGSGLFAAVVILMAMGSLTVLFSPFRYFGIKAIAGTYFVCALAEVFL